MKLNRISTDADLSEASFDWANKDCYGGAEMLVVAPALLLVGVHLARKHNIKLVMDDDLPCDAWYVKNKYFGVFSPGA